MEVKSLKLDSIMPYGKNAKKHDKRQINNVAESIKQYGFVQPIVVDRDGVIVIGHYLKRDMEKFIKRQRRKEGGYGETEKRNRHEAVREPVRTPMHTRGNLRVVRNHGQNAGFMV